MTKNPSFVIQAQNIAKHIMFEQQRLDILKEINIDIQAAETLAIVGASGSGKSTLLGLLAGLDLPSTGHVMMCGHNLSELDEEARATLRAQHVGFIFQSFQLLPSMTALENVMLPLELAQQTNASQRAKQLLSDVGLAAREQHYPQQLSGGEQQRVAIARAFALSPTLLFADEPTGNLDTDTGEQIIKLLFELNAQQNTTLIMVTHDSKLAERCQTQVHLHGGKHIAAQDTPSRLKAELSNSELQQKTL